MNESNLLFLKLFFNMKSHLIKISSLLVIIALSTISCSANKNEKRNISKEDRIYYIRNPREIDFEEINKSKIQLPEINREFRGVWIATVANINWPSKRNLSVFEQKTEALKLLDLLEDMNFNAVILQVRPSADAIYHSSLEPWSIFLTGEIGKIPEPFYDPLQFWIEESHKRGMELHVWLNPYRAHHSNGGKLNKNSMVNKMPEEIVRLKNGMYWFDPSNPKTQDHVSNVVKDIVKRYDIDGVHFDDYFYPYASYNGGADFPDQKTWNSYKKSGGNLSKSDWRRNNVNVFIERIYKEIKEEKKHVKFGISPFGIWKSGYPEGTSGLSQYDELYADAKLWLNKGWVDYFTPQLYWPINSKKQSFTKLLKWWNDENIQNRHLWPGLNTVEIKADDKTTEITNQIKVSKEILNNKTGVVHYSMAGLLQNPNLMKTLKGEVYKEKVLIPAVTWVQTEKLNKPNLILKKQKNNTELTWNSNKSTLVNKWILYKKYDNEWEIEILKSDQNNILLSNLKNGKKLNTVAIQAIDRLGNESEYDAKHI